MRTPSFIRSISSRLPTARRSGSAAVAPLPEESRFSLQVNAELDALRSLESNDIGKANWLAEVLDATIATQKLAQEPLGNVNCSNLSVMDKEIIDEYLEDNVELLDACNGTVEKMSLIREYMAALKMATRSRTDQALSECENLERKCARLDKCSSNLSRLMGRKMMNQVVGNSYELHEVLSVSKEVASVACLRLQRALSFKSKQGLTRMKSKLPTFWTTSLNESEIVTTPSNSLEELELLVMASRTLRDQAKSRKGNVDIDIDSLLRSCEALEEGMKLLEERVMELYRHLISIRMALLGILSQC